MSRAAREELERLSELVAELIERVEELEHPTGLPPAIQRDRPKPKRRIPVSHR